MAIEKKTVILGGIILGIVAILIALIFKKKQGGVMATEEQTLYNRHLLLSNVANIRAGQRLTISNREVTKLSFVLCKFGYPTGNVTFTIRRVSDDSVINSKVWGDASALPDGATWEEVAFTIPVTVNGEVRILAEFAGGDERNYIQWFYYWVGVTPGEFNTLYVTSYSDYTDSCAYSYTYKTYESPATGS